MLRKKDDFRSAGSPKPGSARKKLTQRLPKPKLSRGKSFAEALRLRKTVREISGRKVSAQVLSNLLFAARGVNRRRGPFGNRGITAASASNSQEIDVYVALENGTFLFDADGHALVKVTDEDVRASALGPHLRARRTELQ